MGGVEGFWGALDSPFAGKKTEERESNSIGQNAIGCLQGGEEGVRERGRCVRLGRASHWVSHPLSAVHSRGKRESRGASDGVLGGRWDSRGRDNDKGGREKGRQYRQMRLPCPSGGEGEEDGMANGAFPGVAQRGGEKRLSRRFFASHRLAYTPFEGRAEDDWGGIGTITN